MSDGSTGSSCLLAVTFHTSNRDRKEQVIALEANFLSSLGRDRPSAGSSGAAGQREDRVESPPNCTIFEFVVTG
jgi:hypothetical protein